MPTKMVVSGRIRKADYKPTSRQLDLHWDNKAILADKNDACAYRFRRPTWRLSSILFS